VLNRRHKLVAQNALAGIEVGAWLRADRPVEEDVEHTVELLAEVVFEKYPCSLGGPLEVVDCVQIAF
jgi:hypothetical protein